MFIGKFWKKELESISASTGIYTCCGSTLLLTQLLVAILISFIYIIKKYHIPGKNEPPHVPNQSGYEPLNLENGSFLK